jgi:hypothetical protein
MVLLINRNCLTCTVIIKIECPSSYLMKVPMQADCCPVAVVSCVVFPLCSSPRVTKFNHNPKLSSKYHILKTSQTQKTYDISTTLS